jgi:predicted AlkP superfamily phosphohydrolase/phosphomutase
VLVLLQFDAVDLALVERMMAKDKLPTLAALRAEGSWRPLECATDLFEPYLVLYTGTELGQHALYSAFAWSAAEQRLCFLDELPRPETVGDRISRAGRRSFFLDPFQLWPPARTNGIAISGWQFEQKVNPRWSSPPSVARALARRFGRPPVLNDSYGGRSTARLLEMRRDLLSGPARAADAVTHVLMRERFDLVWINLVSAHQAGHNFWELGALSDGASPEIHRELERTLEDVYCASDAAFGRILATLPPDADVIMFSPTGMGANNSRSDMLPDMLRAVLGGAPSAVGAEGESRGSSIWKFRAAVPAAWRGALARRLPGRAVRDVVRRLYLRNVDWSTTRAFALPGDHLGLIRLNLREREREGIVRPAEAEALMEQIASGLETFTDPDGAPSVASVERVAQAITGTSVDDLPDLVVRWSERPSKDVDFVSSKRHGKVLRRGVGSGWSGNHDQGAWIVLPRAGGRLRELGRPPQVADIAATACALAGADMSGLAGEPLLEAA